MPDETKLAFTNCASRGSARSKTSGVGHCRFLSATSLLSVQSFLFVVEVHEPRLLFQFMQPNTFVISSSIGRR
jgi:hypothetical protein